MTEQQLNGAQIGARFEQMDGECMPQRMRRDRLRKSGQAMCLLASCFDGIFCDRVAGVGAREEPLLRARRAHAHSYVQRLKSADGP